MPTENRSSNTELSKIVTEALVGMVSGVTGMKPPADEPLPGFIQAPIDRAVTRISDLLAQPAPQPHPEPIAWMVGTAFWWTKEEAERDAAETGLPIVGLGPMTCAAPAEQHQGEPVAVFSIDATGYRARILESATSNLPADGALLYASADPREIERQRADLEAVKAEGLFWHNKVRLAEVKMENALNKLAERDADLEFWKKSCRTWEAVANGMHVRLYNVLLAVLNGSKLSYHAWPLNSAELEPLDASSPVFLVGGKDGTIAIRPYSEPETASAEPTDRICTHPVGCTQCSWCGFKSQRHTFTNCAPGPRMSALAERQEEASALVEIDERADYEKWLNEHIANHGSLGEVSRRQMLSENPEEAAWEGWEGRASRERKP